MTLTRLKYLYMDIVHKVIHAVNGQISVYTTGSVSFVIIIIIIIEVYI